MASRGPWPKTFGLGLESRGLGLGPEDRGLGLEVLALRFWPCFALYFCGSVYNNHFFYFHYLGFVFLINFKFCN